MTGRVPSIPLAIPERYREKIRNLAERIYRGAATQNSNALNLTAAEADNIVVDINKVIEEINAELKGSTWTEAYTALGTLKEVVQGFSASLSMRRTSVGQYGSVWPGSQWRGGA